MALSSTARGTGTHNSSSNSFTFVPASNLAAGSMAVLCIAIDSGGSSFSVSDTNGNTWTIRKSVLVGGSAGLRADALIATTSMDGGTITTGTTITISWTTNVVAKCAALWEIVGSSPTYVTGAAAAAFSTTSLTTTTSSITSGNIVIGSSSVESATTLTTDSDTSNGNWSTAQGTSVGSASSAMQISTQTKVTTGTGTQTYNISWSGTTDGAIAWIEVREIATTLKDIINGFGIIPHAR